MISIKNAAQIQAMRRAGSYTRQVCDALAARVVPGITTGELDEAAAQLMRDMGVESAFLGYRGYPGHVCISVNEEVVHGIPGRRRIAAGDLVSLDVGVRADGYYGDMARTIMVGVTDPELIRLVVTTRAALEAGISQLRAGRHLSDASAAIEKTAKAAGFSVVRDFVGHGIGSEMHEEPPIPNFGPPGRGPKLAAGMTLAIEPMLNAGGHAVAIMKDGWTVVTRDRRPSAHFEHTVLVLEDGAEILTAVQDQA